VGPRRSLPFHLGAAERAAQPLEKNLLSFPQQPQQKIHFDYTSNLRAADFLSLGYFQTSLFTWLDQIVRHPVEQHHYFPWNGDTLPTSGTVLSDGSVILSERNKSPKEDERVLAVANEFGRNPVAVPESLDPGRETVLEAFLDELLRDGVRPVLYLPPYHPRAYALMTTSERNKIVVQEQRYFEALAQRKGLTVVGSYNPADVSLDGSAFFDDHILQRTRSAACSWVTSPLRGQSDVSQELRRAN